MAGKSNRKYMQELYDLMMDGAGGGSRASRVLDILGGRGFNIAKIVEDVEGSTGDFEDYKTGGKVSRKSGGKIMQGYKAGGKV
jgi:hypothetical protein